MYARVTLGALCVLVLLPASALGWGTRTTLNINGNADVRSGQSIAVDPAGRLVTSNNSVTIQRLTTTGAEAGSFDLRDGSGGDVPRSTALTVRANGSTYLSYFVQDTTRWGIRVYNAAATTFTTLTETPNTITFGQIAVNDLNGDVYVRRSDAVTRYDAAGTIIGQLVSPATDIAVEQFTGDVLLAVDGDIKRYRADLTGEETAVAHGADEAYRWVASGRAGTIWTASATCQVVQHASAGTELRRTTCASGDVRDITAGPGNTAWLATEPNLQNAIQVGTDLPVATFTTNPDGPVPTNTPITFTSTATDSDGTITNTRWDLNGDDDYDDATGASVTHTFATAGDHSVRMKVTDDELGVKTRTVIVHVDDQAPTATFDISPSTVTTATAVTFTSTATDPENAISSREWDLDGDATYESSGPIVQRTFDTAGTYLIRHRVVDGSGHAVVVTRQLTVKAASTPGGLFGAMDVYAGSGGAVTIADVDNDGFRDVVSTTSTGAIVLRRGSSSTLGGATQVGTIPPPATMVTASDLDDDGNVDLVVSSSGLNVNGRSVITRLLGNGDGTFVPTFNTYNAGTTLGVGARTRYPATPYVEITLTSAGVLLHRVPGGAAVQEQAAAAAAPAALRVARLDDNAGDDLVISDAGPAGGSVTVLRDVATGGNLVYLPAERYALGAGDAEHAGALAVACVDDDPAPDLIVSTGSALSVLLNDGDGRFGSPIRVTAPAAVAALAAGDLGGDGRLDLLAAGGPAPLLRALIGGGGDPLFSPLAPFGPSGATVRDLALGDLDDNGGLDVVFSRGDADGLFVLRNGAATDGTPRAGGCPRASGEPAPDLGVTVAVAHPHPPIVEGDTTQVKVTLEHVQRARVVLNVDINDSRVIPSRHTLTFAPGETEKTVDVTIGQDALWEGEVDIPVTLTDAFGEPVRAAYLADVSDINVRDDEPTPTITATAARTPEGSAGAPVMTVVVRASIPVRDPLQMEWRRTGGTATFGTGGDARYPADVRDNGSGLPYVPFTLPALGSRTEFTVPIDPDLDVEPDETLVLSVFRPGGTTTVTGVIADDDAGAPPGPGLSLGDVTVGEGEIGRIPVTLDAISPRDVRLSVQLVDGGATGTDDYFPIDSTGLLIPAGSRSGTLTVYTREDTAPEPTETLTLKVVKLGGATATGDTATVTIIDDDAPPPATPIAGSRLEVVFLPGIDIAGTGAGARATCDPGTWEPAPASFAYEWLRGGVPIPGATRQAYTLVAADFEASLVCRVTATSASGAKAVASSRSVDPPSGRFKGVGPGSIEFGDTVLGFGSALSLALTPSAGPVPYYPLDVSCALTVGTCVGTVRVVPRTTRRAARAAKVTTYAGATYSVGAGARKRIKLKLTPAGRKLKKAVRATLVHTTVVNGRTTSKRTTITLKPRRKR